MIFVLLLLLLPQAVTHCCSGRGPLPDCSEMQQSEGDQWESRLVVMRLRRIADDEDTRSSIPARPTPTIFFFRVKKTGLTQLKHAAAHVKLVKEAAV